MSDERKEVVLTRPTLLPSATRESGSASTDATIADYKEEDDEKAVDSCLLDIKKAGKFLELAKPEDKKKLWNKVFGKSIDFTRDIKSILQEVVRQFAKHDGAKEAISDHAEKDDEDDKVAKKDKEAAMKRCIEQLAGTLSDQQGGLHATQFTDSVAFSNWLQEVATQSRHCDVMNPSGKNQLLNFS